MEDMNSHENIQSMLALSAAGLLEPRQEREIREHVRGCAECAARLEELGALATGLRSLSSPEPPPYLAARVARDMSEYADRRENLRMAAGSAVLAWAIALATAYLLHTVAGDKALFWLSVGWTAPALISVPVIAGFLRRQRREL